MSWTNIFQTYKEVSKQWFLISTFYKGLEHSIKPYTHKSSSERNQVNLTQVCYSGWSNLTQKTQFRKPREMNSQYSLSLHYCISTEMMEIVGSQTILDQTSWHCLKKWCYILFVRKKPSTLDTKCSGSQHIYIKNLEAWYILSKRDILNCT